MSLITKEQEEALKRQYGEEGYKEVFLLNARRTGRTTAQALNAIAYAMQRRGEWIGATSTPRKSASRNWPRYFAARSMAASLRSVAVTALNVAIPFVYHVRAAHECLKCAECATGS